MEDGIVGLSDGTLAHDKVQVTNGTSATNAVLFGSDVNLYRSAANVLKTDDAFLAANGVQIGASDAALTRTAAGVIAMSGSIIQSNMAPATTLPASPVDGQQAILVDSTSAPTYIWTFRWLAAASKWIYTGGTPAHITVDNADSTLSATYVALTNAGPSFTVPRAGDYLVTVGSRMVQANSPLGVFHSYDVGATGALDADSASVAAGGASGNTTINNSQIMTRKKVGLSASTALVSKYRSDGTRTATFSNRFMSVVPITVT